MVLITGATGLLGRVVYGFFAKKNALNTWAAARNHADFIPQNQLILGDLCQESFVKKLLAHTKPEIIVHCAALTNLQFCEQNPEIAHQSHVQATEYLAKNAPQARFLYISTDSVFDGKKGNYTELDTPNPLNIYAKTKLEGENAALTHSQNALVLRTNIFGLHSPTGASLAEWLLQNLQARQAVSGFDNVFFNPVYTQSLAEIIYHLAVGATEKGILNVGSQPQMSKYEFALAVAYALKLPTSLVMPRSINAQDWQPARPLNTTLNIDKLQKIMAAPSLVADIQAMMHQVLTQ